MKTTLAELVIIRNLIDSVLADKPNGSVDAALYSARVSVVIAIRHQVSIDQAREAA
jgi:hypothetical protein